MTGPKNRHRQADNRTSIMMIQTRHLGRSVQLVALLVVLAVSMPGVAFADPVKTANGAVEGTTESDGIRVFRGIPFGAPPVGDLRWKPPQPAKNWDGVRPADKFGNQCMQRRVFNDMVFRSSGTSEDCLYLNVWTPAKSASERLPVLVYFFGGGYIAGDGSEPRYDGASMARKGIVALTINYRLNVFGFLAHPELTRESPQHASGNYGLLDKWAALQWVQKNIAAFGGDPRKVTIAGESAGSISVSAVMASPLTKGLIAGAIGESGAMIDPTLPAVPLAEGEKNGMAFATGIGAPTLAALRALPAEKLLEATATPGLPRFSPTVDGYFLPKRPAEIFAAGEQARVPLLAGWNSEESGARSVLGSAEPTPENYANAVRKLYAERAEQALKAYPGTTSDEVLKSATALAGDRFIGYSTWKWLELHGKTGGKPVFRYFYLRPRPGARGGASHSAEIEYAMGNLPGNTVFAWTPDDHKVSATVQGYFANFIKTGDPNGAGLPKWPAANAGGAVQVMHLDVNSRVEPESGRERYLFLEQVLLKK
jgi:para-nitrobenzyl esterase